MGDSSFLSLPAMQTSPQSIVFTDWDGTVTLEDSNDFLTDNLGYGVERRKWLNQQVLEGKWTFRDSFMDMLQSINTPLPECIAYLKQHVKLDPGFLAFYTWCKSHNIPVIIVSSGMTPIIRALLEDLVGMDAALDIQIVSNDVAIDDAGKWKIVYRDDSPFGHDKSLAIKPYANLDPAVRPTLFYCGDGVSDLSAARETDLLFAKKGRDLVTYCERENIAYNVFDSFADIHKRVKAIVEDNSLTLEQAVAQKEIL
ncbi:hypothetical protein NADFUDRAFT_73586 [Nadsonia fulvescens var. elongata DSM 6958]|uniref:Phosphoserine phosphatase n=1 Tax=Nadsonia fulvescens var. elongata DSM 6958 TaxID=857566 RepID=A0A1E3PM16_9ASCO|nr:hypothetical protein NADFUDRAFT_73586 [Nadsonia fulvescens var. elongata DSM 6958]